MDDAETQSLQQVGLMEVSGRSFPCDTGLQRELSIRPWSELEAPAAPC